MKSLDRFSPQLQLGLIALLMLLFGLTTAAVVSHSSITLWDSPVQNWAIGEASPGLDRVFTLITALGSYQVVRLLALPVGAWLLYRRDWRRLIMLPALIGLSVLGTPLLKIWIDRTRPGLPLDTLYRTDASYPSGHTLLATVFYVFVAYLAWVYLPRSWQKWLAAGLAVVLIFLIGLSRVVLEVHFPTDVLGGWIAGALLFLLVLFVVGRVFPWPRFQPDAPPPE